VALIYRKTTRNVARKYERSPGMEPNVGGGVTHMTVINPGRAPSRNPFQWISGRGRSHHHLSPAYRTVRGAKRWAEKHASELGHGRLYPVDEYGTLLSHPLSRKQVLSRNARGRRPMGYNVQSLKRAMRRNMSEEDRAAIKAASRAVDTGSSHSRKRRSRRVSGTPIAMAMGSLTPRQRRRISRGLSRSHGSHHRRHSTPTVKGGRVTAKGAQSAARASKKAASRAKKAASKAKHASTPKAAKAAAKSARKAASKAKKDAKKAVSKAKKAKATSKRAASKAASAAKREASKAAAAAASAESHARAVSRGMQRRGRISKKQGKFHYTTKVRGYKRVKGYSASPFYTGRLFNPPYIHATTRHAHGAAGIRMAANLLGRTSQRGGRAAGQRIQLVQFGPRSRRRGYATYVPGFVSERSYTRRFTFGGAAKRAHERALREGYARSRRRKSLASNRRNRRTSMGMRRNKRRRSRRSSRRVSANKYIVVRNRHHRRMRRNSKRHSKRHSMRSNHRRRRHLRRNLSIMGTQIDLMNDVAMPSVWAIGGLMASNGAANAVANIDQVRNVLDAGQTPDQAIVTKSVTNLAVALATIVAAARFPMLRQNLTAIVAGEGAAFMARLLRGTQAAPYLGTYYATAGMGEYVQQPLSGVGAYVQDPSMGEYVQQPLSGVGEYVQQPLSGMGTFYAAAGYQEGIDPADHSSIDGLMDVMEATAGGPYEAAAGLGTYYAAAGFGDDATAAAAAAAPPIQPVVTGAVTPAPVGPPGMPPALPQPPFVSTETPADIATDVTGVMHRDTKVQKRNYATDEGRGFAGGIFGRTLFSGMQA